MYYLDSKDADGNIVKVEVTKEIYDLFIDETPKEEEHFRNQKRRRLTFMDMDLLHTDRTLEDDYFIREDMGKLFDTINACTPIQRERFLLHFLYGLTYTQIGEMSGCSYVTVHRSVQKVLKKIEKVFEKGGKN